MKIEKKTKVKIGTGTPDEILKAMDDLQKEEGPVAQKMRAVSIEWDGLRMGPHPRLLMVFEWVDEE